jgi:hypothetical protein
MFMDDIKNEYFYPMGGTSVVLEFSKNWVSYGKEGTAVVHPSMARFIDALRVKRPTWRFKSTERVYDNEGQELRNFDVYDGDEQLGRVWTERHWRTGEDRYCLNNHRVEASRQRGSGSFSTKVGVATKKVLDSFGVKSLDERASDAQRVMAGVINHIASEHSHKFLMAQKRATNALADYIVDNWEQLRAHAGSDGLPDLPALRDTCIESSAVLDIYNRAGGTMLVTCGEQFLTWRYKTEATMVGFDALTDKQRAGLGILKLVENKTLISSIGVRVDTDKFFLLD